MEGLEGLKSLVRLYLVSNKFKKIQNLSHLTTLEVLDVGDNKIKSFDGIVEVLQIKELYIASNKIQALDINLIDLQNLRILGAQCNEIPCIQNLPINLEELYLQ